MEIELLAIEDLGEDRKLFRVEKGGDFIPGQFISILFECEGKEERRPYSICSSKDKDYWELVVKMVEGKGCNYLASLKVGDKIKYLPPMGHFVYREADEVVLISTGTGIGPFRSMIPDLLKEGKKVTLIAGYRTSALFSEEFKNMDIKYVELLSPDRVHQHIPEIEGEYYICGLFEMVKEAVQLLMKRGVERKRIIFERYD